MDRACHKRVIECTKTSTLLCCELRGALTIGQLLLGLLLIHASHSIDFQYIQIVIRGHGSMVEHLVANQRTGVRFSLAAHIEKLPSWGVFLYVRPGA